MWVWMLFLAIAVGLAFSAAKATMSVRGLRESAAGHDEEAARIAARVFQLRVGSLVVLLVGLLVVLVVALLAR